MSRPQKNADEKAVKLSISLPASIYEKLMKLCKGPPKRKTSKAISDLIANS